MRSPARCPLLPLLLLVACGGEDEAVHTAAQERLVARYEQELRERDELWVRSHARSLQGLMFLEAHPGRSPEDLTSLSLKLADEMARVEDGIKAIEVALRSSEAEPYQPLVATWVAPDGPERAIGQDGAARVPQPVREGLLAIQQQLGFSGAGDQRDIQITLHYTRGGLEHRLEILRREAGLPPAGTP